MTLSLEHGIQPEPQQDSPAFPEFVAQSFPQYRLHPELELYAISPEDAPYRQLVGMLANELEAFTCESSVSKPKLLTRNSAALVRGLQSMLANLQRSDAPRTDATTAEYLQTELALFDVWNASLIAITKVVPRFGGSIARELRLWRDPQSKGISNIVLDRVVLQPNENGTVSATSNGTFNLMIESGRIQFDPAGNPRVDGQTQTFLQRP